MDLSRLYRDVVETSPDGIWVVDLDGRTVYANPQIARIHGIPAADLSALSVFDTLDEAGRKQFLRHLDDVDHTGVNATEVEVQWVRQDGSIVWMLVTETQLLDDDGRPAALLHRYTDYTDRRQLIESLRASEEALEDEVAQNTLLHAVASAANEAGSLGDVLRQARALVLLHDDWERARAFVPKSGVLVPYYTADEDRRADADDAFAAIELALAQRCYQEKRLIWDERRLTVVVPIMLGDEVHAVVAITSAPPLWRFELIETMAVRMAEQLARVAERERAQAELAHARDAAMEASRQKSEFLATMSHEIRTPLNGVIGLNDLLQRTGLSLEQRRLATGVQVASRALLDVINDILDFSKIEAGRLDLERLDFEIRPLLDHGAALLAETARDKGLDLVVSCHPDVPVAMSGDPTRVSQVVTNLVSNAVKFTERGGVIVLATAEHADDRADGQVRLRVEVSDTGVGVPPERVAGLFDPFTQGDASTTRVYGGTGLGLAICKEIVEAMGGTIGYSPNLGGGSIFTVDVVLDQARGTVADAAGADGDEEARRVLAGRRVMVVNDTTRERAVLHEQLLWWGVEAEQVDTVDGALALLEADPTAYDVVLLDLARPERDGGHIAAVLRADPVYDEVRLLMVTSAVAIDVTALRSAGIEDVLIRPVLSGVLRGSLVALVTGETLGPNMSDSKLLPVKGRILVVEDNPVNQMVASGLLTALGYASATVDDGQAAVEAAGSSGFDAILMDVQMPRLDGYDATRQIRAQETDRRCPIIAMTAAAIEGERERCLAAGMDDFLTKPIDPTALAATLERWLTPPPDEDTLDVARLEELRELDDEMAYLDRAIDNFLNNSRADVAVIWAAVAAGDTDQLRQVSHRLAGGALNLGAVTAGEALRELEALAIAGALDEAADAVPVIEEELARARHALLAYRSTLHSGG